MRTNIIKKLPYPVHLDIESTNYCLLNCGMCPRRFMKRKKGFMDWKTLQKIIEESKGKTKTCYFHQMGDPLLHPEIVPMLRYIRDAGILTTISTSGVLLTPKMSKALFEEAKLFHLIISFDSLKKEVYEQLRLGADFEQVLENVSACATLKKEKGYSTLVELQTIKMRQNESEVDHFKKWFQSALEGIDRLSFKPFSFWAGHVPDWSLADRKPKKYVCTMFNYSASVYWNGDVVTCCMDYDGFTKVGNIYENSLKEIWDSERYEIFRKAHKEKDFSKLKFCKGCYLASERKLENYAKIRALLGEYDYMPHLNSKTVNFLRQVLKSDMRVLETGSGNSTVWFARQVKEVVAFENLSSWYWALKDVIEEEKLDNITLYYDPEYPTKSFPQYEGLFDIVLLDGADHGDSRMDCMRIAPKFVKPGGYLIIDDVHRKCYEEAITDLNSLGWEKQLFQGYDRWREEKAALILGRQ